MSKNTKYIPSMGLAFSEDNEMKKLSEMAKKGWVFKSYKMLGYVLEKGEPKDLVYCFDSYRLKPEESEQYFEIFEAGGWKHICSVDNYYHFFSAEPGTPSIYTDKSSLTEKYSSLKIMLVKAIVYLCFGGLGFLAINLLFSKFWNIENVSLIVSILAVFCFASAGAMAATLCAIMLRIRKIKSGGKILN